MADLVAPTVAVHKSFLSALRGFQDEGFYQHLGVDMIENFEGFRAYVDALNGVGAGIAGTITAEGAVPATHRWLVDGDEYLGRVAVRHHLNHAMGRAWGHIGFGVRRSARRCGFGTRLLREGCAIASALGIDPAVVTCDVSNLGSRRVIERQGGLLQSEADDGLRAYWVPTCS